MTSLLTDDERAEFEPPPCPRCGAPGIPTWDTVMSNSFEGRRHILIVLECSASCYAAGEDQEQP